MSAIGLLLLCLCATGVSGDFAESVVAAAPGDVALLPCYSVGNVTPNVTSWRRGSRELVVGGASGGSRGGDKSRLTVLRDGSLRVRDVERGDGGVYLCASTLPGNNTFHARVLLQVASGPDNVSLKVDPGVVLPNGTFTIVRGSSVYFNCAGSSEPSQVLSVSFAGLANGSGTLVNNTGKSLLEYRVDDIQPSAQGTYTCVARNPVSHQEVSKSAQVLVYYASDRHPECMWTLDSSSVFFHCSWLGVYPAPALNWTDVSSGRSLASNVTDKLALKLNSSRLSEGQTLRCTARHAALGHDEDRSCTFTLKKPYPVGKPLATALEGTNFTLNCSESRSTPPAVSTWRRGVRQELVRNDSRHRVTADGPRLALTIVNVTQEDGGVYFCHCQNPAGVQELEVYLTVTSSSANTGAVIGLFIAALVVGSAIIIAKTIFSSRHKICLAGFGTHQDRGDVLSLVESDDEEIFQAAVPRLPPVSEGCTTTRVEIHTIPSAGHEEVEADHEEVEADGVAEQQDDTENTQQDLVTF